MIHRASMYKKDFSYIEFKFDTSISVDEIDSYYFYNNFDENIAGIRLNGRYNHGPDYLARVSDLTQIERLKDPFLDNPGKTGLKISVIYKTDSNISGG